MLCKNETENTKKLITKENVFGFQGKPKKNLEPRASRPLRTEPGAADQGHEEADHGEPHDAATPSRSASGRDAERSYCSDWTYLRGGSTKLSEEATVSKQREPCVAKRATDNPPS